MRKLLTIIVLAFVYTTASFAQFEQGKKYLGADINGLGVSYSQESDFTLKVGDNAGYCVQDNLLVNGHLGFDYTYEELRTLSVGAKLRYFIADSGVFLSAGARFLREFSDNNDFQITPEVGYCYFLNGNLALQPSIYYDLSFSDFKEKSRIGFSLGLGWYF